MKFETFIKILIAVAAVGLITNIIIWTMVYVQLH